MAEFTPGLQRRFTRLYPGFTYRQWPGFSPRTHPFGLAGTYVFIKQSGPPRHCDLRFQRWASRTAGTPSPEVTGPICRVPWPGLSPTRLGLLTQEHLCRFSVRARGIAPCPLFKGPRSQRKAPNGAPFPASAPSHHYGTPGPSPVSWVAAIQPPPVRLSGGVGGRACVAAPTPAAREY